MNLAKTLVLTCAALGLSVAAHAQDIVVNGSTTVLPVMQKAAESFMAANPDIKLVISGGGSGNGIKALRDKMTDVAMSSRDLKDKEKKDFEAHGINPVKIPVALDAIIPVVSPKNAVASLTMEQLRDLFAGKVKNCVTNMQLERLASPFGPTGGKIVRPTDGRRPKRIAFVQCAGSRDQNHLNYCSYICCMATLKQCQYICEQYPETQISVFYIDLRAPGRYVKVLDKVKAAPNVRFIKGKVADVAQAADDNVTVTVEDAIRGEKLHLDYDMVVLATGMQPSLATDSLPLPLPLDEDGFVMGGEEAGIFAAGCARMPLDVMRTAQSGTAAALKAVQTVKGR